MKAPSVRVGEPTLKNTGSVSAPLGPAQGGGKAGQGGHVGSEGNLGSFPQGWLSEANCGSPPRGPILAGETLEADHTRF